MRLSNNPSTSENILVKEKTNNTPFVQITKNGIINISGNSTDPYIRKFFLSLFWGINKIVSTKVVISLELDKINAATIRYLFIFFRVIKHHHLVNEIIVFWFYDNFDEDALELGLLFQDQLQNISFMFYQK